MKTNTKITLITIPIVAVFISSAYGLKIYYENYYENKFNYESNNVNGRIRQLKEEIKKLENDQLDKTKDLAKITEKLIELGNSFVSFDRKIKELDIKILEAAKQESDAIEKANDAVCAAKNYEIITEVANQESKCSIEIAKYHACKTDGAIGGGAMGASAGLAALLLAGVTGGTSLAIGAIVAGSGGAAIGSADCVLPNCESDCEKILSKILTDLKLEEIPKCKNFNIITCPNKIETQQSCEGVYCTTLQDRGITKEDCDIYTNHFFELFGDSGMKKRDEITNDCLNRANRKMIDCAINTKSVEELSKCRG